MRPIETYNPWIDAGRNWSGWKIRLTALYGMGEMFDMDQRIVVADPEPAGADRAMTHVIAHLELGHHLTPGGKFTGEQESEADMLTDLRSLTHAGDILEDESTGPIPRFRE